MNPVLGFSLFHCPTTIIILLGSGQMVTLPLVSTMLLPSTNELDFLNADNIDSPLKKVFPNVLNSLKNIN